jgi:cell division protein ZapA
MANPVVLPKNVSSKPVVSDPLSGLTKKVSVVLHGREYYVSCDPGEEERLAHLVHYVEGLLQDISDRNPGMTESRLFMMASLLLADELIEAKRAASEGRQEEEDLMVSAVEHLRARVASIAQMVGQA